MSKRLENYVVFWLGIDGKKNLMKKGRKRQQRRRKKWRKCVEISRLLENIKDIILFLGYLHFSPSFSQSLLIKSLDFQFNQFSPCLHNIYITKYFTWKSKFTININYQFTAHNRQISNAVQSYENLRLLHVHTWIN